MEKNEHAIFLDIPSGGKNGKFHSAVLSTYSIDLIHFDAQLLNLLHRKQICSVNIFVDYNQMEKSMEYVNPLYMRRIGRDYCVTGINVVGAFHPKINFFVGDDSVLVVFGTGNLTVTGHGKNHEAFTGFMIDKDNDLHRPLIEECWKYLLQFTSQCGEFERNRILREIPENCSFLDSSFTIEPHRVWNIQEGIDAALLYNDTNSSILRQIVNLIPLEDVQKVTVVSPYFDERGESIVNLSNICSNAQIDVLIHEDCSLPPCMMPSNKRITFYDFNDTKRGRMKFKTFNRQLHAKILHFKTSYYEYCVIGSANATMPGLGFLKKRGINEEFCVLYRSKNRDFLSLLGLKPKKKLSMKIHDMKRIRSNENNDPLRKHRIISAQYENDSIIVCCEEKISHHIHLAIDNGSNAVLFKSIFNKNGKYIVEEKLDKKPSTCYLINKNKERVSNIVFINWIEMLETTNPSKTSRNLNRFISRIENEGYEGMDVADILSDIMWELVDDENDNNNSLVKTASGNIKTNGNTLPEIKYNVEYDNDDAKSRHIIVVDRTSRLIECIEESIRRKIRSINDAIIDEEEEGSAEISNDRDIEEQDDIIISKKSFKSYGDLSTSLLNKYKKLLIKRGEQVRKSGDRIITKDDLNFFSLSFFTAMEICYLNRFRYVFDENDSMTRSYYQKLLYDSLDRSISHIGLTALERFVSFCNGMRIPPLDESYRTVVNRFMKYVILYGTLFYKFVNYNEIQAKGKYIIKYIKTLTSIFGIPSIEYLKQELAPLSERYDYVFRMHHVVGMLELLNKS